jgi:hypothetical protein
MTPHWFGWLLVAITIIPRRVRLTGCLTVQSRSGFDNFKQAADFGYHMRLKIAAQIRVQLFGEAEAEKICSSACGLQWWAIDPECRRLLPTEYNCRSLRVYRFPWPPAIPSCRVPRISPAIFFAAGHDSAGRLLVHRAIKERHCRLVADPKSVTNVWYIGLLHPYLRGRFTARLFSKQ